MSTRKYDRTRFIYQLRMQGTNATSSFTGQLVDATPVGMMVVANERLEPGAPVTLTVELPRNAMGDGHMSFDAIVRWCEQSITEGFYDVGVYLAHAPEASRELLWILVDRFHELQPNDGYREDEDPFVQNKGDDPLARRAGHRQPD